MRGNPPLNWDAIARGLGRDLDETPEPHAYRLVLWATYKATAPVMIGDFMGNHYEPVYDATTGEFRGVVITGMPTAKSIIGKARWLLRVAIAHVLNLRTHREADNALAIRVGGGRAIPLIGFLFGRQPSGKSKGAWSGVIRVQVFPRNAWKIEGASLPKGNRNDQVKAILEARRRVVEERYVNSKYGLFYISTRKNKYKSNSNNRFNALLARDSFYVESRDDGRIFEIIPKRDNVLAFIEPLKADKASFELKVYADIPRLTKVVSRFRLESEILSLVSLVIGGVPIILGLGKGSTRAFGHFGVEGIKYIYTDNSNLLKIISSPKTETDIEEYFNKIIDLIKKIAKSLGAGSQQESSSLLSSLIPRLPIKIINKNYIFVDNKKFVEDGVTATNIIGEAVTKSKWKNILNPTTRRTTANLHTWPLGLPRGIKKFKQGYFLVEERACDGQDRKECTIERGKAIIEEGRRQSLAIGYLAANNKIVLLMFPSGDIANLVRGIELSEISEAKSGRDIRVKLCLLRKPRRPRGKCRIIPVMVESYIKRIYFINDEKFTSFLNDEVWNPLTRALGER